MGTSMAYYIILNTGQTQEELKAGMQELAALSKSRDDRIIALFGQLAAPDQLAQLTAAFDRRPREKRPVIGYSRTKKWFPMFEVNLCEGHTASGHELEQLYQMFHGPVLAFSIFDSDVLYVSYLDEQQRVFHHRKSNFPEDDDYDADLYSPLFPEFLAALCGEEDRARLREIWAAEDYVFADDRMDHICSLLGAKVLDQSERMPDGYIPVYADQTAVSPK